MPIISKKHLDYLRYIYIPYFTKKRRKKFKISNGNYRWYVYKGGLKKFDSIKCNLKIN